MMGPLAVPFGLLLCFFGGFIHSPFTFAIGLAFAIAGVLS